MKNILIKITAYHIQQYVKVENIVSIIHGDQVDFILGMLDSIFEKNQCN